MASFESLSDDSVVGRCKWYDDRKGYGFIVVCEGQNKNSDIFVHNKNIKPMISQRRTIKKGEYVSMNIAVGEDGRPQATDVTGVFGGPLMCDHFFRRSSREKNAVVEGDLPVETDSLEA
ncbi:cold-shock protein [Tetraselmis virus 1]|uniref:Cold-shock protein n=1 Tax=Tetraselmis virus 1 TaxID=2060617 RepID=A0A2P0VNI9_9VIRU|nr:cold-shock protein [Tetraselmis virus 1]AUF82471.1 cold-shock protein [Tetraselmis virus 1]